MPRAAAETDHVFHFGRFPLGAAEFRRSFCDDQSSIIRFIEDNWLGGTRIGQGSFDGIANSISQMFDFSGIRENRKLILDPNSDEPFGLVPTCVSRKKEGHALSMPLYLRCTQ